MTELRRFLAIYADRGRVPRPVERVYLHTARLHDGLVGSRDVDELVERALAEDLRKHAFMLEGLARLYKGVSKKAEKFLEQTKELEDALGLVGARRWYQGEAVRLGAPPEATAWLAERATRATKALRKILAARWLPDRRGRVPGLVDLVEGWGSSKKWLSVRDDRAFLQKEIARRLDKVAATPLDMSDLQGGVHELRRQLRWFPIYMIALDGLFVLDDRIDPIPEYARLREDPIAKSPFSVLPATKREPKPIRVPRTLFLALSKVIADLGRAKDQGESGEAIFEALVESRRWRSPKAAHDAVGKLVGSDLGSVHRDAQALYDDLRDRGLLLALRDAVARG